MSRSLKLEITGDFADNVAALSKRHNMAIESTITLALAWMDMCLAQDEPMEPEILRKRVEHHQKNDPYQQP